MSESVSDLVDWAVFRRLRAELGADFVRILGYFQEDGEKSVANIEMAMRNRDTVGLVRPAHKLKTEARQFGAEPLGLLAEEIEFSGRRAIELRGFPDELIMSAARLRPIYLQTMEAFTREVNPLVSRRPVFGQAARNHGFGIR